MGKFKQDNVLDPNQKARWGFTMNGKEVKVGPQTVAQTGGTETVRAKAETPKRSADKAE